MVVIKYLLYEYFDVRAYLMSFNFALCLFIDYKRFIRYLLINLFELKTVITLLYFLKHFHVNA